MSNLLISCEHGGNKIPSFLKTVINIPQKILESHRGLDIGALNIAIKLGRLCDKKVISNKHSRLVIDYNRSLNNKNVWSIFSKPLSADLKDKLVADYQKYRKEILSELSLPCIHLSIHSFTPVLNGEKRNCDFAILYDPAVKREKEIAGELKKRLNLIGIPTRLNYPYLGTSDGLTTSLRKKIAKNYCGFELEFNQSIVHDSKKVNLILATIQDVIKFY